MARTAIVVPGHGAFDGADYRISTRCRRLVVGAERLADRLRPAVVVFTGWSPTGGPSEAEQMRDAWKGPDVELVVEPTARVTAENAARTLPHYLRARYFFHSLYSARSVKARLRVVPERPSSRALVWELAALPMARAQLRRALRELERTDS